MISPSLPKSRLEIPCEPVFLEPALAFITSYAERLGMEPERIAQCRRACQVAIDTVLRAGRGGDSPLAVDAFEHEGKLYVEVLNRGVPILLDTLSLSNEDQAFYESSQYLEKLSLENLGRLGQTVVLGMSLGPQAARRSLSIADGIDQPMPADNGEITIRQLDPDEASALSQLFYYVYGYNYIHEFVYYPEKIRAMIEEGRLISIVGVLPDGRVAGHVGLMKWADEPAVYEPCLGVVDPRLKSRGLFSRIFEKTMDCIDELPMQYAFFDFVTNHDFSQRFVAKYGAVDLAVFVGCQSSATQARLEKLGLGEDSKEMDRYSLLYSVIPRGSHPFGREVVLPGNLGEMLGFLLRPLNLNWIPGSRFQALGYQGDYQVHFQPAQNAVIFDLFEPGRKSIERILGEWARLLRNGYQYAAIEVPCAVPGLGPLYDILSESGFFVSGFIPYHHSARLGLRFQAIGPTKVAWDDIKLYSPTAKRLLGIIRENYERNGLL